MASTIVRSCDLMNAKGEYVKHFLHTVDVDQLANELAKAL